MDNVPIPSLPICPACHQPVQPEFYFCPNCGRALKEKPLSTTAATQAWIYALSIVMPWIAFLALHYWPGVKYIRSDDENAKQIGIIASVLMGISTIAMMWLLIVWTQQLVQSSLNNIGNLGGFGRMITEHEMDRWHR